MVTKRRAITIAFFLFLIVLSGIGAAYFIFLRTPVISDSHGVRFVVREGESFQSVTEDLQKLSIIKHPLFFNVLIHSQGKNNKLRAGEYLFPKGSTPYSIFNQMMTGSGLFHLSFTIVPGWTFKQVRDALQRSEKLQHTIQALSDHDVMALLGQPNLNPEGQFYPETYYYTSDSSDTKLLKRANKMMQDKLNKAWETRASGLPYTTAYDALIAASLIEKEGHFDDERPLIAGVIINRLRKNMLLQIDPTVIYGMGVKYTGKIYKQNLIENTPYNTYVHKGLPPTPIAMPGKGSINAALHPEETMYLYYVARGDGYHQFSKTLSEHHAAVSSAKPFRSEFFNIELIKNYFVKVVNLSRK